MYKKNIKKYNEIVSDIIVEQIKELEISENNSINNFNSWELIKYLRNIKDNKEFNDYGEFYLNNVYEKIYDNIKTNKNILEIGCGTGILSGILSENDKNNILGIDVNQTSIFIANKLKETLNKENLNFQCIDISTLDNINKKFDIIICIDILGNFLELKTNKELKDYVLSLFSLLNENGTIIIFDYKKIIEILKEIYTIHDIDLLNSDKKLFSCVLKK